MDNQNGTEPKPEGEGNGDNIRTRLRNLAEKAAALNESLASVEENLKEASGEVKGRD
jgi:hypothetical protein